MRGCWETRDSGSGVGVAKVITKGKETRLFQELLIRIDSVNLLGTIKYKKTSLIIRVEKSWKGAILLR
jgi:hypothetical protein